MYQTKKDQTWKPGRNGMMLPIAKGDDGKSEARRVIKALIKTLKNEAGDKPKLIPKKEKD
jgi:hypothetical protein